MERGHVNIAQDWAKDSPLRKAIIYQDVMDFVVHDIPGPKNNVRRESHIGHDSHEESQVHFCIGFTCFHN